MAGIGLLPIPQRTGNPVRLSADGYPIWLDSGVTVAWELIPAPSADTTLADGTFVPAGTSYIEPGTLMVRVLTGSSAGKFAPFDSSQTDGRQTLTLGDCGLKDETLVNTTPSVYIVSMNTTLCGLIVGGLVFRARLKVGGTNQATLTQLLAALPTIQLTRPE